MILAGPGAIIPPPRRRPYIPTLDGWRAIAILLVIGSHSVAMLQATGRSELLLFAKFLSHAGYGVDIFFALSGYLICTLLLAEKEATGISLKRFYARRCFRILPLVLAYLVVLGTLRSAGAVPQVTDVEIAASVCFCRNYLPGSWYTGHFWSLAIEEHFYLLVPLMLACLRWSHAMAAACAISVACVIWRMIEYRYLIVQPLLPWTLPQLRTENRCDALMNGAIIALLLHKPYIRSWFARHLRPATVLLLLVATVVGASLIPSQPTRRTIAALALPLFIAFTVLRPTTIAGRLLELGPVRWVGRLSFSLYIWQQLVLIPAYLDRSPGPLGDIQRHPGSAAFILAMAVASYYALERPLIRLGHKLTASGAIATRK